MGRKYRSAETRPRKGSLAPTSCTSCLRTTISHPKTPRKPPASPGAEWAKQPVATLLPRGGPPSVSFSTTIDRRLYGSVRSCVSSHVESSFSIARSCVSTRAVAARKITTGLLAGMHWRSSTKAAICANKASSLSIKAKLFPPGVPCGAPSSLFHKRVGWQSGSQAERRRRKPYRPNGPLLTPTPA